MMTGEDEEQRAAATAEELSEMATQKHLCTLKEDRCPYCDLCAGYLGSQQHTISLNDGC